MKHRLLLLGLSACALLACDSASPVAPTGTVLSINANPTQISLSGNASQITVTGFKPDGNPLNPGTRILVGTDVGDLYDAATGGNLVSTIEIAGNGQATAFLRGDGRGGAATVTATLTTGGEASATATVQIGETAESQPTLVISANPSILDVLQVATVDFLARNSDNTPLGGGRIRLTTDLGTLHETQEEASKEGGIQISSLETDNNGEAVAFFRAGNQAGTGRVRGIVGTSEEVVADIDIRDQATEVILTRTPASISSAGTDSIQLSATVVNARGDGVRNILVRFDTVNTTDGANPESLGGTYNPGSSVLTLATGIASASLTLSSNELLDVTNFDVTATISIGGEPIVDRQNVSVN